MTAHLTLFKNWKESHLVSVNPRRGKMEKFILSCLVLFTLLGYSSISWSANRFEITIDDNFFDPPGLTILAGDTVRWVNQGMMLHTSTSGQGCAEDGKWNSGYIAPGMSFTRVFPDAGPYPYFCIPHCLLFGMVGTITVDATTDVLQDEALNELPSQSRLFDNYPNPFNAATAIKYGIPQSGHVDLTIHNIKGELVSVLVSENQAPGNYSVVWDGRNADGESLSSGVYLLRLIYGGEYPKFRLMVLLR